MAKIDKAVPPLTRFVGIEPGDAVSGKVTIARSVRSWLCASSHGC